MNRFIKIISVISAVIILMFSVSAAAASESITTKNLTVKTDRLFEVNVGFKSGCTITAASFKLSYNKNDIAFREVVCNLSRAKVSYNDKSGVTDVIFLCSDGVKCREFPTLFSVKYKKLNDSNTNVSVQASDCVDGKLKNFTPPNSAVCNVKGVLNSSSEISSSGKSKRGGASYYSGKSKKSDGSYDDDILETSGKNGYAVTDDDIIYEGDNDPAYLQFVPFIMLAVMILVFAIIIIQNHQIKKEKKRREEEEKITGSNTKE